mgnify:CR=1 FL=1
MLRCGKHKGKTFEQVEADRTYCSWVMRLSQPSHDLRSFAEHLSRKHGGVVGFGVHRLKFYSEVWEEHRDYSYCCMQLSDPGPSMRDFADYVHERAEADLISDTESESTGPETVDFEPPQVAVWEDTRTGAYSPWAPHFITPAPPDDGTWVTEATFDASGTYVLRCLAADGALDVAYDVTVTVTE